MDDKVKEIKEHYRKNATPELYSRLLASDFENRGIEFKASLQAIYDTLKSGKYRGKKLLEIGSGATVHNIASASRYFDEITQSDFVDANCEELKKWLKGESELDWSEPLKAVAEIEGYRDLEKGVEEIASRIRKCVKNVVHSDVTSDRVIPLDAWKYFDVIIASLTLECAAPDFESFVDMLRKLHNLLRPGGGLLMTGFLNGPTWKMGDHEFHYLRLNKDDIDRALDIAKFEDKNWKIISKGLENDWEDEDDRMYFVSSTEKS